MIDIAKQNDYEFQDGIVAYYDNRSGSAENVSFYVYVEQVGDWVDITSAMTEAQRGRYTDDLNQALNEPRRDHVDHWIDEAKVGAV